MIFEGAIATKAILEENKRDIDYLLIDINKKDRNTNYIKHLASKKGIDVILKSRDKIDEIACGKTHGGIITIANNRKFEKLTNQKFEKDEVIFFIDGIEDPYNLGYALRSLYCFGIKKVLINSKHLINSDNIIIKSSAGASEKMSLLLSENPVDDINYLKSKYFTSALLIRSNHSEKYYNINYQGKYIIGVGGEKRGLSKNIQSLFEKHIYIPYSSDFRNALNATSAIVTIASEIQRQKDTKSQ